MQDVKNLIASDLEFFSTNFGLITVFGSAVMAKKGFINTTPSDIDIIISPSIIDTRATQSFLKKIESFNLKVDLHISSAIAGIGIFKNEPIWQGDRFENFATWIEQKVEPKNVGSVESLKNGIAHLLRGMRYFENVKIPQINDLVSDEPMISNSRYIGYRDLLQVGGSYENGCTFEWARYGGGFTGNTIPAILAALRKVHGWGISNDIIEKLDQWITTLESADKILQDPGIIGVENGAWYGPRCNFAGLQKMIDDNTLIDWVVSQTNLV